MVSKKHRQVTQDGIEFIKRWEGYRPTAYKDVAGFWTIGIGHLIKPSEKEKYLGAYIGEGEAEILLRNDLYEAERGVTRLIKVPLADCQFDSLVSFCFNLGSAALQRSTLRMKLNRWEYWDAAQEFERWIYAGGRKIRGLVRRRKAEKEMFLYGKI